MESRAYVGLDVRKLSLIGCRLIHLLAHIQCEAWSRGANFVDFHSVG